MTKYKLLIGCMCMRVATFQACTRDKSRRSGLGTRLYTSIKFIYSYLGLGELCSKIRPLCYAPMLPTTGHYALGWVLLCYARNLIISN